MLFHPTIDVFCETCNKKIQFEVGSISALPNGKTKLEIYDDLDLEELIRKKGWLVVEHKHHEQCHYCSGECIVNALRDGDEDDEDILQALKSSVMYKQYENMATDVIVHISKNTDPIPAGLKSSTKRYGWKKDRDCALERRTLWK